MPSETITCSYEQFLVSPPEGKFVFCFRETELNVVDTTLDPTTATAVVLIVQRLQKSPFNWASKNIQISWINGEPLDYSVDYEEDIYNYISLATTFSEWNPASVGGYGLTCFYFYQNGRSWWENADGKRLKFTSKELETSS
jgi:hypothetical protein